MISQKRATVFFLLIVTFWFSLGLLMVFNTVSASSMGRHMSAQYGLFWKQCCYALLGVLCLVLVYFLGMHNLLDLGGILFWGNVALLVLVLIPGVGSMFHGSRRWISIFGHSLQPSEFMKLSVPLYYVHRLRKRGGEFSFKDFIQTFFALTLALFLILLEPDNGSVFIIFSGMLVLFFLTGLRWRYWLLPVCVLSICGGLFAWQMVHVQARIKVFLSPESDLQGKGHQPYQAKIAVGSGGFWGRGLGQSVQKLNYLPESRSDYIAAIFAEEFGFLGVLLLLMTYLFWCVLGFYFALQAEDVFGFYLVSALVYLISFQAFLHLGISSGLLPSKGTNLPFFSHGGCSLLVNFIIMGIILSVGNYDRRFNR